MRKLPAPNRRVRLQNNHNAFAARPRIDPSKVPFRSAPAREGSPLQIFHAAPGSAAMQQLPWSFVPTVLVPFWLILHAIIWAQLRRLRSLGTGE